LAGGTATADSPAAEEIGVVKEKNCVASTEFLSLESIATRAEIYTEARIVTG
jgi:hypothetical protein